MSFHSSPGGSGSTEWPWGAGTAGLCSLHGRRTAAALCSDLSPPWEAGFWGCHHSTLTCSWGTSWDLWAESRGTPRADSQLGCRGPRVASLSAPYLCCILGRMLDTASAGGRATASRRICKGTSVPAVRVGPTEPCSKWGSAHHLPWGLFPTWASAAATGAEPRVVCGVDGIPAVTTTQRCAALSNPAGLPPAAALPQFRAKTLQFVPRTQQAGLDGCNTPQIPPAPLCLISRSQHAGNLVAGPRRPFGAGTSFPCLGSPCTPLTSEGCGPLRSAGSDVGVG